MGNRILLELFRNYLSVVCYGKGKTEQFINRFIIQSPTCKLLFFSHNFDAPYDKTGSGEELIDVIEQAYQIASSFRRYEKTQASYEREKDFWIDYYKDIPLKKIDRTGLSEEELKKKQIEFWKEYLKDNDSE